MKILPNEIVSTGGTVRKRERTVLSCRHKLVTRTKLEVVHDNKAV